MEEILAPCGYRCDLCPVYYINIAKVDKQKLSDGYLKYFNSQISPEEIKSCTGCFDEGEKDCLVRSCVFKKRIDNCAQCPDFGCDKLKTKMNVIEDNIKDCELNNLTICIFSSIVFARVSLVHLINLINSRP